MGSDIRHRYKSTDHPGNTLIGSTFWYNPSTSGWIFMGNSYYNYATLGRVHRTRADCYDQLHSGPPYKEGGPFDLRTFDDSAGDVCCQGTHLSVNSQWKYDGGFVCMYSALSPVFSRGLSMLDITQGGGQWADWGDPSEFGATGWERFRPGRSSADLGVFLGEIRDLPRMLKGTAKFFKDLWSAKGGSLKSFGPKDVADHWLNTQFGWLPFLSDMRKFYNTYKNIDRMINHIVRNNGQWRRRGGIIEQSSEEETLSESAVTAHSPVLNSYFYNPFGVSGYHKISRKTETIAWFEGCFRYYIPALMLGDKHVKYWKQKAIRLLFGGTISPALLWELTPWSWLIDYFSNVGDIVANMDTGWAENLVAKYAYVMRTERDVITVSSDCNIPSVPHMDWEFPIERKSRLAADPFGFSSSWGDLTSRQWSILAALGISRAKMY